MISPRILLTPPKKFLQDYLQFIRCTEKEYEDNLDSDGVACISYDENSMDLKWIKPEIVIF